MSTYPHEVEAHTITIPVSLAVVVAYAGVVSAPDGLLTYRPDLGNIQPAVLSFGGHSVGRWVIDSIEGYRTSGAPTQFLATLRYLEGPPEREPLDDDVASWLKARRDTHPRFDDRRGRVGRFSEWDVLNDLLDTYREHRATGTPLNQEIEGP